MIFIMSFMHIFAHFERSLGLSYPSASFQKEERSEARSQMTTSTLSSAAALATMQEKLQASIQQLLQEKEAQGDKTVWRNPSLFRSKLFLGKR